MIYHSLAAMLRHVPNENQGLEICDGILLNLMKQRRQKEQPFYVKRIRLKHSVIKTNEILQSISISDFQSRFNRTMRQEPKKKDASAPSQFRKSSRERETIFESELLNAKASVINYERMRNLLKVCKTKKTLQNNIHQNNIGLDIRRLVPDPNHSKKTEENEQDTCSQTHRRFKNLRKSRFQEPKPSKINNEDFQEFQTFNSDFATVKSSVRIPQKRTSCEIVEKWSPKSPNRRKKAYLYQRVAGSENKQRQQTNQVYEKRIKSYTQFLWKNMLAHNIYLSMDLQMPKLSVKKLKAYVGFGNNCNMIKGLIKRRFWWTVSEELTDDCLFIWTQLKINKIFQRQQSALSNIPQYVQSLAPSEERKWLSKTCLPKKHRMNINSADKDAKQKYKSKANYNTKILSAKDSKILTPFLQQFSSFQQAYPHSQHKTVKQPSFAWKTKQVQLNFKKITTIEDLGILDRENQQKNHNFYKVKPLVHNHLENNFYLGNKKALFYNMKEYYKRQGKNVFEYLPLTFHIKNGFNDPEYKKFVHYYGKRAKIIQRDQESERYQSRKMRNIWIVKPGENSNQGRGITVIDEIYQLNNIIKQSEKSSRTTSIQQKQTLKTFIVQLYIDRPFLYNQRKFDIRHYMLITNLYGITRAYWYEEGYIRTSSYLFNIHNFEPQIHLTNDAIQKQYPEYGRYEPYNKISYSQFQNYLNSLSERRYDFKREIISQMKIMAMDAAKSVASRIAPKRQMNNFEVFGLDFMIDRNFKPWLIEINTNPCLDCSCPLLDRIIPYMVEQSLKLSLDLVYPPPCHYPNTSKHNAPLVNLETFKYQLIFDSSADSQSQAHYQHEDNILSNIGEIEDDEEFNDDGRQIRLQDFT